MKKLNLIANKLPIIHHEEYVCPLPENHRFKMKKFMYLYNILIEDKIIDEKVQVMKPRPIDYNKCIGAHSEDYVKKFFDGLTTVKEQRKTGFNWTSGLLNRVRYETGGTLLAAKCALEYGLACSTAGGTHHAFPNYGSGYCLINDLAVTSTILLSKRLANRILIVDLDVHQGDGTAYIFKENPDVFTFSMHCRTNFPLRKQKSDLDIELEPHSNDQQYIKILMEILPAIMNEFKPDLILYDAGVDPHVDDQLGKLSLTDKGLYERDYLVLKEALQRGIPVATVVGGGYDEINKLSARHTIIHRVATKLWNTYL